MEEELEGHAAMEEGDPNPEDEAAELLKGDDSEDENADGDEDKNGTGTTPEGTTPRKELTPEERKQLKEKYYCKVCQRIMPNIFELCTKS